MPVRWVALLLVVVLSWTSLSTHEEALAYGFDPAAAAAAQRDAGSMEAHHLDDLPSQGHNQAMGEAPARSSGVTAPALVACASRLPAYRPAAHAEPLLPQPLHPPDAAGMTT